MARKTVDVSEVRFIANSLLSLPDSEQFGTNADFRRGVTELLIKILFSTDNYKGFQYLDLENREKDDTKRKYL